MANNYKLLFIIYIVFSQFISYCQCAIRGKITDSTRAPISYASVGLLEVRDSSIYKGIITDIEGNYCFEQIKKGNYFIKASSVGFKITYSAKIEYDSTHPLLNPTISMYSQGTSLDEVSVTAMKKMVEFKNGNIIVNVDGTTLSMGNSVYDLLARLPGVTIIDSEISIQGISGVKIMIDGKIQQLSNEQLFNILKSMNASQIQKIEVLKNPPVKYDAAGTGGMINVITKKNTLIGTSGSVFAGFSQGFYGNPHGGITFNHKGRKINFFSGFTGNKEAIRKENFLNSDVAYNSIVTSLTQNYVQKHYSYSGTFDFGADWYINKNNSVGFKVEGGSGIGNEDRTALTTISDNSLGYRSMPYTFENPNPWLYADVNVNAEHLFDTLGTVLRFSADYSPYSDKNTTDFDHHFLDSNSNEIISPRIFRNSNTLNFYILSSKLDFEKKLKKSTNIEAGLKVAYVDGLSSYTFENLDNATGNYISDANFTNVFSYKEQISAAYFNVIKEYKKISMQMGLRGENTLVKAQSKTNSVAYTRQYFNLFPMVSVEYKRSQNHNFQLSANRRINRPDYNYFNPYRNVRSLLIVQQGNPYLRPEYITSVNFTYAYASTIFQTVSFSRRVNALMDYSTQNDSTKVRIVNTENLDYGNVISYSLYYQEELTKWCSLNFNASVFYLDATGTVNGLPFKFSTVGFNPGIFSRFILPDNFKLELNAYYISPRTEGVNHVKSRSSVDVAIKRTLLKDKLSIAIAFNDIFFTRVYNASVDYQNIHNYSTYRSDTRRVNLSLNYNFGNVKVKQREITSNDEEKNRIKR